MSKETPVAVSEILNSGFIGQGQKVDEFENKLSQYFNHPYVNTVNSCTSAIHLALRLIKDTHPEKDEVITIPFTCTATNTPILANGLKIVWADTDPMTCNIDLIDLEKKINEKTLAIIIVHWAGYPVDLDALSIIQSNAEKKYGYKPQLLTAFFAVYAKYLESFPNDYERLLRPLSEFLASNLFLPNTSLVKT
jgi:dTDP-4-amino-4,6-dideoxygalactose transaminase